MRALLALAAVIWIGCAIARVPVVKVEPTAIPLEFYDLPCGDGYIASSTLPLPLSRRQDMQLLNKGVEQLAGDDAADLSRAVVIIVYLTPKAGVTLTVDFKQSVLEIRVDQLAGDFYHTDVWTTDDPRALLRRMAAGTSVPPTQIFDGRLGDDIIPEHLDCPKRTLL
jgi:hypothetical protein